MYAVVVNCSKLKLDRPAPARELYRGPLARRAVEAVDAARRAGIQADLYFLSAKHGIVPENRVLEPYDEKLRDDARDWSASVGPALVELLAGYRAAVLALTGPYMRAVEPWLCGSQRAILLGPSSCPNAVRARPFSRHKVLLQLLYKLADAGRHGLE